MKKPAASVIRYSVTQMFFQIGTVMIMAVAALSGRLISPSPELATIPLALSIVGTLIGLTPAAFFMKKYGRKAGFLSGTVIGMIGVLIIIAGIMGQSFFLFSLGFLLYGLQQSFLQYLRFAAMESVDVTSRPNALSWILVAGIPAAFLGPLLGLIGFQLIKEFAYVGSYLILFSCLSLQLIVIATTKNSIHQSGIVEAAPRTIKTILKQYDIWVAIIASSLSFALMVMLMAAAPIAMKSHGHVQSESTLVLQWHVLAMYIPSFFSGFLIKLLGKKQLIICGIVILGLEACTAMLGLEFSHFAIALILLGIGWNFMFVGGTNLLIEQYKPSEKNKVQAINDSVSFGLTAISTYGAGYLESKIGWFQMNLFVIPLLVAALIMTIVSLANQKKPGTL